MDDTTQSKASDAVASAATRKRRSSILKSQRAPRTPFCELEFNVATPTDTSKSRRVSFSRKTGVAEFATNEATTTWKNFYEEHNRTLESSGNESEMNHGKQPIAHLGKRIFDEQFQEVEAVDYMATVNPRMNMSSSINNVNFAQLEFTETKLVAPHTNFELSACTETRSKLFRDDLTNTCAGEVTDCIDVNFSAIQQIVEKDDLDEIEKDLQRQNNIVVCQGPFTGQNLSEYIEVDLNMTHVAIANDESDMSITDTIHSPKVQDVSKSCSIDKKVNINDQDWVVDKENIVVNPYVAPRESLNFAVNEEANKILVFDGKRLILENEKPKKEYHQKISLPNKPETLPQRKTIVINCNDDLPNFVNESQVSKSTSCFISELKGNETTKHRFDETLNAQKTIMFDNFDDISMTQAIPNVIKDTDKRRTIVYDNEKQNISITQALPSNILDKDKRRTLLYEDDNTNISITQAVTANIIMPLESNDKRKTIVFENEDCNISMTQAIPNVIKDIEKRQTIVYDNKIGNISITQALPSNILDNDKKRTLLYEDDNTNISITQAVPANINMPLESNDKRKTIVFENEDCNISMTQVIPNVIKDIEKRRTIVYNNEKENISITQALPSNILDKEKRRTLLYENDNTNISITQAVPANVLMPFESNDKRKTIVFENEDCNISMTQAIPANIMIHKMPVSERRTTALEDSTTTVSFSRHVLDCKLDSKRSQTSVVKDNSDKISVLHLNNQKDYDVITNANKRKNIVFENDDADISMTQFIPMNQFVDIALKQQQEIEAIKKPLHKDSPTKHITMVFENDNADISMTQAVPMTQIMEAISVTSNKSEKESTNKRRTVLFENDDADISVTQTVPLNRVIDVINGQQLKHSSSIQIAAREDLTNKRRTVVFENDDADLSITQVVPINRVIDMINEEKNTFNIIHKVSKDSESYNSYVAQAIDKDQVIEDVNKERLNFDLTAHKEVITTKRRKAVFEDSKADVSMSQTIDHLCPGQHNVSGYLEIQSEHQCNSIKDPICFDTADVTRNVVYNDNAGDISTSSVVSCSSVIVPDEHEKKGTRVVEILESPLENVEYLINVDKEGEINNKDNETKSNDISMTDVTNLKSSRINSSISQKDDDMCVTKVNLKNSSPKNNDKSGNIMWTETATTLSKPIPTGLGSIHEETIIKPHSKSISRLNDTLTNANNTNRDIFVYQSVTAKTQNGTKGNKDTCISEVVIDLARTNIDETKIRSDNYTVVNDDVKRQTKSQFEPEPNKHIKVSFAGPGTFKPKSSILHDLLDMSQSSLVEVSKNVELVSNSVSNSKEIQTISDQTDIRITDKMFYITKNCGDDVHADKSEDSSNTPSYIQEPAIIDNDNNALHCIEFKNDDVPLVQGLKENISVLEKDKKDDIFSQVKPIKEDTSETGCKMSLDMSKRKSAIGFKTANDTKELLEMISDFTDKRQSRIPALQEIEENEDASEPADTEKRISYDNKIETDKLEPMQCDRNLKRQSTVLSREDYLRNLSMASALLQKSRCDFSDSDIVETDIETPSETRKKSVRLSYDIVKKLEFDDSNTEKSIPSQTLLKKTAFGEISYMTDPNPKVKVIPEFMKNVSDGIKELMDDLIKPVSEVLPFTMTTLDRSVRKYPSICSTQIQANLITSSQIDLQSELYSDTNSGCDLNKISTVDIVNDAVDRSVSTVRQSPVKSKMEIVLDDVEDRSVTTDDETTDVFDNKSAKTAMPQTKNYYSDNSPDNVLVFDHANPLNNVLLAAPAPYAVDIHAYNPIQSKDVILEEKPSELLGEAQNRSEDIVTKQYRVEVELDTEKQEILNRTETQSVSSNTSNPVSMDQSTEPDICKGKDIEVNTVIAMRGNKELLDASSSLTLVDDAMCRSKTAINVESFIPVTDLKDSDNSPVNTIYPVEDRLVQMESDFTLTDKTDQPVKPKKRVYSPTKRDKHLHCTVSSLDATPVPISKMQKRSFSPQPDATRVPAERDHSPESRKLTPTRQKSPKKVKNKKPGTEIVIQQLVPVVHVKSVKAARQWADSSMSELAVDSTSSAVTSCYASSNNLRADSSSGYSCPLSAHPSRVGGLPKTASNTVMSADDLSEDIVAMIDAMPFMGSNECQWECASSSGWTLLLLHARLRLTVRLASAPRLRHDTPVLGIELETLRQDKKNPIAYLCVSFASEIMRYYISRGCREARELPALVRQVARVARLAEQWARVMHYAHVRLAYTLSPDGWLALKVVNVQLRTVWEVSMRVELVVEAAGGAPCPRACDVRVQHVVSAEGAPHSPPDVTRLLADTLTDWGHAPRTIWKIFRYLKNKKRDDSSLLQL